MTPGAAHASQAPTRRRPAIKGAAFRACITWFADNYGELELRRRWEALPGAHRGELNPDRPALGLLASSWYPATLVHTVADTLTQGMAVEEFERFAEAAGRATVASLGRGVQRAVFGLLMTPERYGRYIDRFWAANFSTPADLRVEVLGERHHRGFISGWAEHHPLICSMLRGGKPVIYEAMGCHGSAVEKISCVADGALACVSDIRWSH